MYILRITEFLCVVHHQNEHATRMAYCIVVDVSVSRPVLGVVRVEQRQVRHPILLVRSALDPDLVVVVSLLQVCLDPLIGVVSGSHPAAAVADEAVCR